MRILGTVNIPICIASFFLISIGVLVIYSSSYELALQQIIFTILGAVFFLLISGADLRFFKNLIKPLYITIFILLVAVFILGIETRGSLRWIPIGIFNIQPSEFAKPILILLLAKFWSENSPTVVNIFKSLLWSSPLIFLIFKQPDLGSALTVGAIWLGMLFAARISLKKIIAMLFVFLMLVPVGWYSLHGYQKDRISSFISPESDPLGRGYNVIQSTIAVGSGEFFGRGLGRGTQSRLQFLPEFRTDFIFASIAEEMGLVGSLLILGLYLFLLNYFLRVAHSVDNSFNYLVIIGVYSMFLFQVFINIGMNIGILPITGITLPLISYGGSSLVTTLISLGMVASSAKKR